MLRSVKITFVRPLRRMCFLVTNFKDRNYRRALGYGQFYLISIQGWTPLTLSASSWVTAKPCVSTGLKTHFLVLMLPSC